MSIADKAAALVMLRDSLGPAYADQKAKLLKEVLALPLVDAAGVMKRLLEIGFITQDELVSLTQQLMGVGAAAPAPALAAEAPPPSYKSVAPDLARCGPATALRELMPAMPAGLAGRLAPLVDALAGLLSVTTAGQTMDLAHNEYREQMLAELDADLQRQFDELVAFLITIPAFSSDEARRREAERKVDAERRTVYECGGAGAGDVLLVPHDDRVFVYAETTATDVGVERAGVSSSRLIVSMDISSSMNHDEKGTYVAPGSEDHIASSIRKARGLLPPLVSSSLVRRIPVTVVAWNHEIVRTVEFLPDTYLTPEGELAEDANERIVRAISDTAFRSDGATDTEVALNNVRDLALAMAAAGTDAVTVWFLTDGEQTYYHDERGRVKPVQNNPRFQEVINANGTTEYQASVLENMTRFLMTLAERRCNLDFHICHFGDADAIFLRALRETLDGHFHAFTDVEAIAAEMATTAARTNARVALVCGAEEAEIPAAADGGAFRGRGTVPRNLLGALKRAGPAGPAVLSLRLPRGTPVALGPVRAVLLDARTMHVLRTVLELEPALQRTMDLVQGDLSPAVVGRAVDQMRALRKARTDAVAGYARSVRDGTLAAQYMQRVLESVGAQVEGLTRTLEQFHRDEAKALEGDVVKRQEFFSQKEQMAIAASVESMRVRLGHGMVTQEKMDKEIARLVADSGLRARRMLTRQCFVTQSVRGDDEETTIVTLRIMDGDVVTKCRRELLERLAREARNADAIRMLGSPLAQLEVNEYTSHRAADDKLESKITLTLEEAEGATASFTTTLLTDELYHGNYVTWRTVTVPSADLDDAKKRFMDPLSCMDFLDLIEEGTLPCYMYTIATHQSVGLLFNAKELIQVKSGGTEGTNFNYFRLFWRLQHTSGEGNQEVQLPGTFSTANAALPMAPEPLTGVVLACLMPSLIGEFVTGTPMAVLSGVGDFYIGYLLMHMRQRRHTGVDITRMAEILCTLAVWIDNPHTQPKIEQAREVVDTLVRERGVSGQLSPGRQVPVKALAYSLLLDGAPLAVRYAAIHRESAARSMRLLLSLKSDVKHPVPRSLRTDAREWMCQTLDAIASRGGETRDDDGVPVRSLEVARRLASLVSMPRNEAATAAVAFLREEGVLNEVVRAVHELLVKKGDEALKSGQDLLRWPRVQRLLLVFAAIARYPIDALKATFASFKAPAEFEGHMERMLEPLRIPEAPEGGSAAPSLTDFVVASCVTSDDPDSFWLLERLPDGAAVARRYSALATRGKAAAVAASPLDVPELLTALWDVFSAALQVWNWAGSASTCFGLHDADYDVARALKHPELADRLNPSQRSDYEAVRAYKPIWEVYDKFVPPPVAVPGLGDTTKVTSAVGRYSSLSKPHLQMAVIGMVDSGKSTTSGHLLVDAGVIDDRLISKLEREAADIGKASFKYAWLLDRSRPERERGLTINVHHFKLETEGHFITILDSPGHRDFIKNMAKGAAQADFALLIVSASPGEFEAGIAKTGTTREHLLLAYTMGVKRIVIAVNKMDTVGYSEARFEEVQKEVSNFIAKVGYKVEATPFVPISGYHGVNLSRPPEQMPWYKGWTAKWQAHTSKGTTLLEALDAVEPPVRAVEKPFRMVVSDLYRVGGVGTVVAGTVMSGILRPGMNVSVQPIGVTVKTTTMEIHNTRVEQAFPGDAVAVCCKNVSVRDFHRGYVLSDPDNDPCLPVESFVAQIVVVNHPSSISKGWMPVLMVHTASIVVRFDEIISKIDRRTGVVVEENPKSIKTGDAAMVRVVPTKAMCAEPFAECPGLGRFAMRDGHGTACVGIIKSVERNKDAKPILKWNK